MSAIYVLGGVLTGAGLTACLTMVIASPGWPIVLLAGVAMVATAVLADAQM